jgi:putative two-component system hydrogenase maturation factor HypX/HoxX
MIAGAEYFLFGGHEDDELRGEPGSVIAQRHGAVCRATIDGAVWIPQLRRRPAPDGPATCKLPATLALRGSLAGVPQSPAPLTRTPGRRTYQEISYREADGVGYLEFAFPGGAMSTGQCRRLLAAYRHAQARPVKVIVLGAPRDFFCNGIHLHVIEAAADPAAESWRNINAIDDLVEAILTTTGQITVAAVAGNAAAGGLMLALAADQVWCRAGAVLNPHYRLMGLHGSEYWTYTLPRRVGAQHAARLTEACLPVTPASALRVGLIDKVITGSIADYHAQVAALAAQLARGPEYAARLTAKAEVLAAAERQRPLAAYRAAELAIMSRNFSDPREPYAGLRRAFVYKHKPTRTPPHLALQPALPRHGDPRPPGAAEAPSIPDGRPGPLEDQATFLDCPAYLGPDGATRCGLPAEVETQYSIESTDGALESARIRCPQGHWFNGPIEAFTMPQQPATASPPPQVTIQDRGAQVTSPPGTGHQP